MPDRLRRAAAWLGLVTDERYDQYADEPTTDELTENVEYTEQVSDSASVTPLRRTGTEDSRAVEVRRTTTGAPRTVDRGVDRDGDQLAPRPAGPVGTSHRQAPESRTADVSRIVTLTPRTYNDARAIGEHFRDGVPVIMNLSEMEDADAKRLVDFAAGLIFGVRGTIERVTSRVFLLSPQNVSVTAEDKERLVGGFFNQS